MPGGRGEQAQGDDRLRRYDVELPLAAAVAKSEILQLRSVQRSAPAWGHFDLHQVVGIRARVVNARDVDRCRVGAGIEYPQPAQLVRVRAGIENGNPVSVVFGRRGVVHRGQEAVRGADVRQDFDVEVAGEFQAPVAYAGAGAGEPLAFVSFLQVHRVEMEGLVGVQGEGETSVLLALVVVGRNGDFAGCIAQIDDPHETLRAVVEVGWEHRNGMDVRVVLGHGG